MASLQKTSSILDTMREHLTGTKKIVTVETYKYRNWLILEKSPWKQGWDVYIILLVLYVVLVIPFRLGLNMKDSKTTLWIGIVVDFSFLVDLILSFFAAFMNS